MVGLGVLLGAWVAARYVEERAGTTRDETYRLATRLVVAWCRQIVRLGSGIESLGLRDAARLSVMVGECRVAMIEKQVGVEQFAVPAKNPQKQLD